MVPTIDVDVVLKADGHSDVVIDRLHLDLGRGVDWLHDGDYVLVGEELDLGMDDGDGGGGEEGVGCAWLHCDGGGGGVGRGLFGLSWWQCSGLFWEVFLGAQITNL